MPGKRFTHVMTNGPFKGSKARIIGPATFAQGYGPGWLLVQFQSDSNRTPSGERITYPVGPSTLKPAGGRQ